MDFGTAVTRTFSNYATFRGRAPRAEYWYAVLFYFVAAIGAAILDTFIVRSETIAPFSWLMTIGFMLPYIALTARRLHDLDKSGWWQLLAFIPLVGFIVLLVWYCTRGSDLPNRFGPAPYAPDGFAADGYART